MKLYLVKLYGLLYDCPFKEEECNCPFTEYRRIPDFKDRLQKLYELTHQEAIDLVNHHQECLKKRDHITNSDKKKKDNPFI